MHVAQAQIIEGTSEEIFALLLEGAFAGQKVRLIIEPSDEEDFAANLPDPPFTVRDHAHLLELLDEGMRGPFHKVTDEDWEQRRQEIRRRFACRQLSLC